MEKRKLSLKRRIAYYLGLGLVIIGFLLFASALVQSAMDIGKFSNHAEKTKVFGTRALAGMGLVVVGSIIRGMGVRGVAGLGIVLDPEKAREDIEPWSRMAGGMVKDAIEETGLVQKSADKNDQESIEFDERLRKLHALYEDGILTEEEYQQEKRKILNGEK